MAIQTIALQIDTAEVTAPGLAVYAASIGRPAQVPQLDGNGKPVLDANNNVVMVANPVTPLQFVKNYLGSVFANGYHQAQVQAAAQAAAATVAPPPTVS